MYQFCGKSFFHPDDSKSLMKDMYYLALMESPDPQVRKMHSQYMDAFVRLLDMNPTNACDILNSRIAETEYPRHERHWLAMLKAMGYPAYVFTVNGIESSSIYEGTLAVAMMKNPETPLLEKLDTINGITTVYKTDSGSKFLCIKMDSESIMSPITGEPLSIALHPIIDHFILSFEGTFYDPRSNELYIKYAPTSDIRTVVHLTNSLHYLV